MLPIGNMGWPVQLLCRPDLITQQKPALEKPVLFSLGFCNTLFGFEIGIWRVPGVL